MNSTNPYYNKTLLTDCYGNDQLNFWEKNDYLLRYFLFRQPIKTKVWKHYQASQTLEFRTIVLVILIFVKSSTYGI